MVSIIFKKKPESLETSGDIKFWEFLDKYYKHIRLPYDVNDLENGINSLYQQISLAKLTEGSLDKVPLFDNSTITGSLWVNELIPLLKERLEEENSK